VGIQSGYTQGVTIAGDAPGINPSYTRVSVLKGMRLKCLFNIYSTLSHLESCFTLL
jgi:hypothetical protein